MKVFETVKDLQAYLQTQRKEGLSIGFVPTMGALHAGHLSLIQKSKAQTDVTVCSIFVNPKQFDEAADFDKYPRTVATDAKLLEEQNCEVLFVPSVAEMYPPAVENSLMSFDFDNLDQPMEGKYRTGHFDGVAKVVKRLLDIVQPDELFMGQKDFQQFAIIQKMLEITESNIKIVRCPIVREFDGLAMSSCNVRLLPDERKRALGISRSLRHAKQWFLEQKMTIEEVKQKAFDFLSQIEGMRVEYFEIVDAKTLQNVASWQDAETLVACTAVRIGAVRLIDNMLLEKL